MDAAKARRAVLIAGPTASGKSALALEVAERLGGIVVNTDAMQVYDVLRVVTARPGREDEGRAPHKLYGFVPPSVRFSTGRWLEAVQRVIDAADPGQPLIFVGGTGLYFDALTKGFADVPEVPAEIALQAQQEIQGLDEAGRMRLLEREDPETARRLKVADPQRVERALAVKRATGRPLSSFQQASQQGLIDDFVVERMVLDPDRDVLRARISRRFEAMFEGGAVDEVKALLSLHLDPSLPAMKAIGVREIADWLAGRIEKEEAVERAIIATHQYAKRQRTWFRNRMGDWPRR
ncbi:tRNA delta(2)-isopentenylpyrophosphate transferase [Devosia geojensis]|uniref:tRNA dimethylallyltransferase n=1 Tax=Devosia geojensis TaxID=443610 RepID=A0A0F5FVY5_9HYPH|nr:tRNA (adenosine(37)-N6)-dimethylallyltransferase MiaA [Devosia geojensis]KKB13026.1 tRNA delta(2)-isopentenylpyrophosphate transferase [Devosia geojensis]